MAIVRAANGGFFKVGGGVLAPTFTAGASGTLHSFTLQDTSGSGSSGFFRVGLAFEKGDMPSGSLPVVKLANETAVRSAVMETNSWSDGSMRKCTLVGEVAGGVTGTETLNVTATAGTQGTSGLDAFAYITANTDLNVLTKNHLAPGAASKVFTFQGATNLEVSGSSGTSCTLETSDFDLSVFSNGETIGLCRVGSTAPRNYGRYQVNGTPTSTAMNVTSLDGITQQDFSDNRDTEINAYTSVSGRSYSLNTAIATTTRREIQDDNPVCVRAFVWGVATGEKHLVCLHYVDLWLDDLGAVQAVEWTPVMSQHWFTDDPFSDGSAVKGAHLYDADARDGTTVLEAFTDLIHPYDCQWAALRQADDDQHARRIWVDKGEALPTLNVQFTTASLQRMMKAGYLPPADLDVTFTGDLYTNPDSANGGITDDYTPLGSNGARNAISGTGGYVGRGVVTGDAGYKAINQQTALRWRQARVYSQASLSVFHHRKDHRTASGGSFNGDVSLGQFPQKISQLGAQTYTGLAAEVTAVDNLSSELTYTSAALAPSTVHGTGTIGLWDPAHTETYGYLTAFLEGERYLADAILDQLGFVMTSGSYDSFVGNPPILWATDDPRSTDLSLDSTTKYGMVHIRHRQERSFGWTQGHWDSAYCLLSDDDRHLPYLENLQSNASTWLSDSIDEYPASQDAVGMNWVRQPPVRTHFQNGLSLLNFSRSNILTDGAYAGHVEFARRLALDMKNILVNAPYASRIQNHMVGTDDDAFQTFLPAGDIYAEVKSKITTSGANAVFTSSSSTLFDGLAIADDDVCYVSDAFGNAAIPAELDSATQYHLINVTSIGSNRYTYQLAATQGGAALTITETAANADVRVYVKAAAWSSTAVIGDGGAVNPGDDNIMYLDWAALEYHYGANGADVSTADMTAVRDFFAGHTFTDFAPWALNGDQIR